MALPGARDRGVSWVRRASEAWRGGVQRVPCDFESGEGAGAGACAAACGSDGSEKQGRGEGQGVVRIGSLVAQTLVCGFVIELGAMVAAWGRFWSFCWEFGERALLGEIWIGY